jgi:hypothetical protein
VRNEPKHWQQTCQTKASGKAAEDQRSYDGELAADAYRNIIRTTPLRSVL